MDCEHLLSIDCINFKKKGFYHADFVTSKKIGLFFRIFLVNMPGNARQGGILRQGLAYSDDS